MLANAAAMMAYYVRVLCDVTVPARKWRLSPRVSDHLSATQLVEEEYDAQQVSDGELDAAGHVACSRNSFC